MTCTSSYPSSGSSSRLCFAMALETTAGVLSWLVNYLGNRQKNYSYMFLYISYKICNWEHLTHTATQTHIYLPICSCRDSRCRAPGWLWWCTRPGPGCYKLGFDSGSWGTGVWGRWSVCGCRGGVREMRESWRRWLSTSWCPWSGVNYRRRILIAEETWWWRSYRLIHKTRTGSLNHNLIIHLQLCKVRGNMDIMEQSDTLKAVFCFLI